MNRYAITFMIVYKLINNTGIGAYNRLIIVECYPDMVETACKNSALEFMDEHKGRYDSVYILNAIYADVKTAQKTETIVII